MTLRETESILETLQKRHPGLTEEMLVTLLRAGGWEEKQITEAKTVFKMMAQPAALPATQKGPTFQAPPDNDHLLLAKNEEGLPSEPIVAMKQEVIASKAYQEPQSLVTPVAEIKATKDDLPHNLPLRPFETSEHIWPFSRYKDVFYGDDEEVKAEPPLPVKQPETVAPVVVNVEEKKEEKPEVVIQEKIVERVVEKIVPVPSPPKIITRTVTEHTSSGDEKLVIMACIMLLAILLLLGYMYSNGRL